MKKLVLILLCCAAATAMAAANPPRPARLRWNNGESLNGEIESATAADLTWKSPLFEDPLQIAWSALHRIDHPVPGIEPADPFSFTLKDGSHIYGNIVAVDSDTVSIHSARHGDAVLKRSEVLAARRIRGGNLFFAGPIGDSGWEAGKSEGAPGQFSDIPFPVTGPGGALVMPYWDRSASLRIPLGDMVDVEFRVHSKERPNFKLSLGRGSSDDSDFSVETWGNNLVAVQNGRSRMIRLVADTERDVALRVCWDKKTGQCSIFSAAGEPLVVASWEVPPSSANGNVHLALRNRGRELSLEFLRVRTWDGKPAAKYDPALPRVELSDGRIVQGAVGEVAGDTVKLKADGQPAAAEFPLGVVDAIVFSESRPQPAAHEATFSYADGTLLMGSIVSIDGGDALVKTSFSSAPLLSKTDALRQLLVNVPPPPGAPAEPPLAALDQITIADTVLHGKVAGEGTPSPKPLTLDAFGKLLAAAPAPAGTVGAPPFAGLENVLAALSPANPDAAAGGTKWPRWVPVGGAVPVAPSPVSTSSIDRAFPAGVPIQPAPALFYTRTGDVLPGTLRSVDRAGAEIDSPVVEAKKISGGDLNAIQFGSTGRLSIQGFSDPAWHVLKGDQTSVNRSKGELEMQPDTSLGHPSAMQASEIKFKLKGNNFSTLRLRLFCSGYTASKSASMIVSHMGNRFYIGMEANEGELENEFQMKVPENDSVEIRLGMKQNQVQVFIDGVPVQMFSIPPEKRQGTGLILEPAGMWGNSVNAVALTDFSASSSPGLTWLPDVSPQAKTETLTIPRFRKDDPPTHALLAANGDVLRGEIEAATAEHFGFRVGLENLSVPRDRVRAVIWLKKPDASAPAAKPPPSIDKLLDEKFERRTIYSNATLESILSFIQGGTPGLKYKLPATHDSRQSRVELTGETVRDAIDKVCSAFDVRYHVESDGTLVFETLAQASQAQAKMVSKAYWLKPSALPATPPVKEILAGQGVAFPDGSTVSWDAGAGLLSMTNLPENQEKLAQLIATDYGGASGSPTHWLLLANGGRFGLVVDKFADDYVAGSHPLYGRIKVPMSEIYSIRAAKPDATVAMESLADWRMVYAPEPVLPEPGGESSPSLGKEAKPFKLPLLAGGDFSLGEAKGKIVVLDFWATWCGPCVKSLPGLIESMSAFPPDQVKFIGVNQGEPGPQVKQFLEAHGWKLNVALDTEQNVGRDYGVDAIPLTVIIGQDGKIAWVKSGYSPDGETEAADEVKKLLSAAQQPNPAPEGTRGPGGP